MGTLIKNPIVYSFAAIAAALLIASILLGMRFSETMQLIFIPYTYDITHGVGATGAKIYSIALIIAQIVLIGLITLGFKLESTAARRIVWSIGIVLTIIYFIFIALGFLINNFH